MSELSQVYAARDFARRMHEGQVDKSGAPITEHLSRVATAVVWSGSASYTKEVVAWLHDVVEDTDATLDEIREKWGHAVYCAVDAITRRECETYWEYLYRCKMNPIARAVKRADNMDNGDPRRIASITCPETRKRLASRYERAAKILEKAGNPSPVERDRYGERR